MDAILEEPVSQQIDKLQSEMESLWDEYERTGDESLMQQFEELERLETRLREDAETYSHIQSLPNARLVACGLRSARQAVLCGLVSVPGDKEKLNAKPEMICEENRFNSMAGADLPADAVAFGAAMRKYLNGRPAWACGEVCDVLLSLGYANPEKDFQVCVHQFTVALDEFKRQTRKIFPTWTDVLSIARRCDWRLDGEVREIPVAVDLPVPVKGPEVARAGFIQPGFDFVDELFAA